MDQGQAGARHRGRTGTVGRHAACDLFIEDAVVVIRQVRRQADGAHRRHQGRATERQRIAVVEGDRVAVAGTGHIDARVQVELAARPLPARADADVDTVVAIGQQPAVHAATREFGGAEVIGIQPIQTTRDEGAQFETIVHVDAVAQCRATQVDTFAVVGEVGIQARPRAFARVLAVAVHDGQAGAPARRQLVLRLGIGALDDLGERGEGQQQQQRCAGTQQTHGNLGGGGPDCPARPCSRGMFKNSLSQRMSTAHRLIASAEGRTPAPRHRCRVRW